MISFIMVFAENDVDGSMFLTLTDNLLKNEFFISSWGFRRKVVQLVEVSKHNNVMHG